ncbi:ParA family protein [Cardinium endosymbiont of Dermatophagoides farinae]|uniref:ParA family protein n=1 Tax=Cardinium endosymbiont of Dermatophagoides farinae TaxID=2597823 RepID=UPI0011844ABF|nr:ParA family protein [Cardinium endosymbiont of Dermatophagoides farinae]TSJ80169.1 AAA family ATPase [Cardinium endosymbiont of Dermatophagoides farinae]
MIDIIKDGLSLRYMAMLSRIDESILNEYIDFKSLSGLPGYKLKDQRFSIHDSRSIIKSVRLNKNLQILKKKFAFYNFKGGVGKTSICFQLSSHIALMGYNVLVIDADPQAHLSTSFGFQSDSCSLTLYDLLTNKASFNDVKKSIFLGFDLIPSNLSLTRVESIFYEEKQSFGKLSEQLSSIENDYDFIFLDTNPTISFLNRNVVFFSDVINLVCETQPYSLNGLKILLEDLDNFYMHASISPKTMHIIPNKYEYRALSSAESMSLLRSYYEQYIKKDFAIRKSEDFNISTKIGKPLMLFAKRNSIALEDILDLVFHILDKYTL